MRFHGFVSCSGSCDSNVEPTLVQFACIPPEQAAWIEYVRDMGRCKDCRCFVMRCIRGDLCKRCVSVRDEDKRELEEQLARAKEAKLTTERERDLAVLQERLLEEEVQRTAEVTRNETRMTAVERMGYTEDIERSANKTIECLERLLTPDEYPLKIVKGKGQYLYDENGEQYLDTSSNGAHVGHCHPRVVEASSKQMALLCTNTRFLNDCMILYAKHLCATLPSHLTQCFFTNTGSEANDLAVQIAQRVAGGTHIVALEGALNCNPVAVPPNGLCDVSKALLPGNAPKGHQTNAVLEIVKQQQLKGKRWLASSMSHCRMSLVRASVQQASCKKHTKLSILVAVCALRMRCSLVMLASGHTPYAFQEYGLSPDIVTMGKLVGNGHPVAVVVTTREVADRFGSCGIEYFNTFGGNPVSMAIADEVLSVVADEGLQRHSAESIGAVHGFGLFVVVEFVQDRDPDTELAEDVK
eukprot:Em0221g1a